MAACGAIRSEAAVLMAAAAVDSTVEAPATEEVVVVVAVVTDRADDEILGVRWWRESVGGGCSDTLVFELRCGPAAE